MRIKQNDTIGHKPAFRKFGTKLETKSARIIKYFKDNEHDDETP
jgi:hypothetical protein